MLRRAAVQVMADGQPKKLAEIWTAIEKLLGRPLSYASVEWCVRMGVRESDPWIARVRPGWYRLADLSLL